MSPERFGEIEELYHAVREAPAEERAALLSEADPEVRREVESLLSQPAGSVFLDRPAIENAQQTLEHAAFTHLAGQTVSHYKILELLGAGGMGVVYKAFDLRLGRFVALKFLPPEMRHNDELKRRLTEEARAASALDHPNIVVIHDIDEAPDGSLFIAMAFHDGATLRERIRGELPVAEALEIARQIASGLARAHEHGILHRDIKPANVIVAKDGVTRIIDFGLAKSSETTATVDGTTKGTPLYMSPEQASGKPVDHRTDLWSLGAVLYEMLVGQPPFPGDSQLQVMRAVVEEKPRKLSELRPALPAGVETIVGRALEKDPARRYQSAAEMARDLSAVLAGQDTGGIQRRAAGIAPGKWRRAAYWVAAAAVLSAIGSLAWRFLAPHGPVTSPNEYIQITNFTDSANAPALSPDGRMLAFFRGGAYFLGDGQVYVKMLPNGESRPLTNDPYSKYDPVFTPDGSRVAYTEIFTATHSWDTWTVPVLGGPPSRLMANAAGLSWIGPDRVLFSEIMAGTLLHMGIVTAKESRAEERPIYFPAHERAMAHYSWASPDQSSVLIVEMDASQAWLRCRVTPMDGKSPGIPVGPEGACTAGAWSPDGRWIYLNVRVGGSSHLWRQRWRDRAPDGDPQQITFGPAEEEGLAVMSDGKSLIASIGVRQSSVWTHDSTGDHLVSQEGSASAPALSADGKRLYYLLQRNNQSDVKDLWQRDLVSGKSNPVLPGLRIVDYEISRDETQVAFTATGAGGESDIFLAAADRSTPPRLVARSASSVSFGAGGQLIFLQLSAKSNYLARVQTNGSGLERIGNLRISDKMGVSPDGEWVLTGDAEDKSGAFAVSLKGQVRRQICTTRCDGKWSPDGKYLYLTVGHPTRSNVQTYILPVAPGVGIPELPPIDEAGPSGMRSIPQMLVAPGPVPDTYAFVKLAFQGNLFRIPLH